MHTKDRTGAGLAKNLMETIERYGLDVSNIRGQAYNGRAAMSGIIGVSRPS